MRGFTKESIEYHSDGFGSSKPAVNVKVRDSLADGWRKWERSNPDHDPAFTLNYIEETFSDDYLEGCWQLACEDGWEMIEDDAREIFGRTSYTDRNGARKYAVNVYSEGRSGGWAVVDGIDTDVESWDAIELDRWARFAKYARAYADDVMYQVVDRCHMRFEDDKEEAGEAKRAAREDIATVAS